MVRSFEHEFLRAVHSVRPELPLAALVEDDRGDWVRLCAEAHAGCISPRFDHVTVEAVKEAHAAGIAVIVWTANDSAEWKRLMGMGVDAIVTDDPAALIRWLNSD